MRPEQQQTISELKKAVTQLVPFSLHDPHSNIILEASVTSTCKQKLIAKAKWDLQNIGPENLQMWHSSTMRNNYWLIIEDKLYW